MTVHYLFIFESRLQARTIDCTDERDGCEGAGPDHALVFRPGSFWGAHGSMCSFFFRLDF